MLYIFSDESGSVYTTEQPYYVRSFIFIKEENYKSSPHNPNNLQDVFSRIQKKANRSKEVKFNDFESDPARYKPIFDNVEFKAYVVFANVRDDFLKRKNPYKLQEGLKKFLAEFTDQDDIPYKEGLEKKLSAAIYYHFWLHYFEKYIIRNSKAVLKYYYKLDITESQEYQYYFDTPQFNDKDYKRIVAKNDDKKDYRISEDRVKIVKKSEDWKGIQLADMVAGSVRKILEARGKKADEQAGRKENSKDHYFKYVRNKLLGNDNYRDCRISLTLSPVGEDYFCLPNPCKIHLPKSPEDRVEETSTYNKLLFPKWHPSKKATPQRRNGTQQ